jgi:hypothetical protein
MGRWVKLRKTKSVFSRLACGLQADALLVACPVSRICTAKAWLNHYPWFRARLLPAPTEWHTISGVLVGEMITRLRAENFKSWQDTGDLRLGRLTGLFGTNSSGKTGILQILPLLKQTVDFPDPDRVLYLGKEDSPVYLGTFLDSVHRRQEEVPLKWSFAWLNPGPLLNEPNIVYPPLYHPKEISFQVSMSWTKEVLVVDLFKYHLRPRAIEGILDYELELLTDGLQRPQQTHLGMRKTEDAVGGYELTYKGEQLDSVLFGEVARRPDKHPLPPPIKCYGFPPEAAQYFEDPTILSALQLAFVKLFGKVHYLGPLRSHPQPSYPYGGEKPLDVGWDGEEAIQALIASGSELQVAKWLRQMGLIHSFRLEPADARRTIYQCWVKTTPAATEVLLPGVGFGVSQILPVLVSCAMLPSDSTLILEQPEIHLHPFAQAALADVLIDAVRGRSLQIIVESHSEHLLRRIQRRIAEEQFSDREAALYFCDLADGVSKIEALELDTYGNIKNWPDNFFGDEMGELAARMDAAARREATSHK